MSTFLISLLILSGTVLAGTPLPEEPLATFRSGSGIGKTKIDAIEEAISEAISKIIDESSFNNLAASNIVSTPAKA